MKKSKLIMLLLMLILGLTLVGCVPPKDPNNDNDPPIGDKDKLYKDEEIPTPNTDALHLTQEYEGKDFITDGIGEVTLSQTVDGDTAIFKTKITKQQITVRFLGIDTPESTYKVEPWGFSAARFTKKVLLDAQKNGKPIVLQADDMDKRVDNNERWLAWVWVDGRLLNMEIVEKCYSSSKASGTIYADEMLKADFDAQAFGTRIWNRTLKDPDYDYTDNPESMTLKQIHERYNNETDLINETDKGKKVRVQGIVTRKMGPGSAYIQQQVEGYWYIGENNTGVVATDKDSFMPYVGDNGNWFVGDLDLEVEATNGEVGQTAYEVYKANVPAEETPMTQVQWARSITVKAPDNTKNTPYIVRPDEWYGIYMFGDYTDITNFVIGREIYTNANLSYHNGSLELIGMNDSSVQIYALNRIPYEYQASSEDFKTLNLFLVGSLINIENLTVFDGYNSQSGGFTMTTRAEDGTEIDIRIQKDVYIYTDPQRTKRVTDWKEFDGKTFIKVVGIMDQYQGSLQIIVTRTEDLTYN